MKIHQFLPSYHLGDAIGNEAKLFQGILKEKGYESDIFCEYHHPKLKARNYYDYTTESCKNNVLIYHHSIGSPITHYIMGLPEKKILVYHNITPPSFFEGINDNLAYLLEKGRNDLRMLVPHINIALGDSEFNRNELLKCGYKKTAVVPILIDFNEYPHPDRKVMKKYSNGRTNILFVGRIAPNKRIEDLIKTFFFYKRIDPSARLLLPGYFQEKDSYYQYLQNLINNLLLNDIHFLGKVSHSELVSYYNVSHVFLSMSEHEGFCVPLVECMFYKVPIVAYDSTAIPYTLGKSGILLKTKNPCEVAELINILVHDSELTMKIIKRQEEQLSQYCFNKTKELLLAAINMLFKGNNEK